MKETFLRKDFRPKTWDVINRANDIIREYKAQGFDLTLRQLYYQFVSRDWIPNTQKSYDRLGVIINEARLAGHIDWDAIKDRTRTLRSQPHWENPTDIISACARQFAIDKWARRFQDTRIEVWIEKDALVGVIERVCKRNDVAYFACRGYVSQSFMYEAAKRLNAYTMYGQRVAILHLGDHDPSGMDMTRDIQARMDMFTRTAGLIDVDRLALNINQVRQYNPPPNPAKMSDSRASDYVDQYGYHSWELDALEPAVINGLIQDAIDAIKDPDKWQDALDEQQAGRDRIQELAEMA